MAEPHHIGLQAGANISYPPSSLDPEAPGGGAGAAVGYPATNNNRFPNTGIDITMRSSMAPQPMIGMPQTNTIANSMGNTLLPGQSSSMFPLQMGTPHYQTMSEMQGNISSAPSLPQNVYQQPNDAISRQAMFQNVITKLTHKLSQSFPVTNKFENVRNFLAKLVTYSIYKWKKEEISMDLVKKVLGCEITPEEFVDQFKLRVDQQQVVLTAPKAQQLAKYLNAYRAEYMNRNMGAAANSGIMLPILKQEPSGDANNQNKQDGKPDAKADTKASKKKEPKTKVPKVKEPKPKKKKPKPSEPGAAKKEAKSKDLGSDQKPKLAAHNASPHGGPVCPISGIPISERSRKLAGERFANSDLHAQGFYSAKELKLLHQSLELPQVSGGTKKQLHDCIALVCTHMIRPAGTVAKKPANVMKQPILSKKKSKITKDTDRSHVEYGGMLKEGEDDTLAQCGVAEEDEESLLISYGEAIAYTRNPLENEEMFLDKESITSKMKSLVAQHLKVDGGLQEDAIRYMSDATEEKIMEMLRDVIRLRKHNSPDCLSPSRAELTSDTKFQLDAVAKVHAKNGFNIGDNTSSDPARGKRRISSTDGSNKRLRSAQFTKDFWMRIEHHHSNRRRKNELYKIMLESEY